MEKQEAKKVKLEGDVEKQREDKHKVAITRRARGAN